MQRPDATFCDANSARLFTGVAFTKEDSVRHCTIEPTFPARTLTMRATLPSTAVDVQLHYSSATKTACSPVRGAPWRRNPAPHALRRTNPLEPEEECDQSCIPPSPPLFPSSLSPSLSEAFVVCQNYSPPKGYTPNMSNPLLDHSYSKFEIFSLS